MGRRSYKGFFIPKNPKKYKGDLRNVVFRSLWERSFMNFCDGHDSIIAWSSESVIIPYHSPMDKRERNTHRYFVDFYVEVKETDGKIQKYLIEIKPYAETQPPVEPKRKTNQYADKIKTYVVNCAKWKAAIEWCNKNDMKFQILTEKELFGKMKL